MSQDFTNRLREIEEAERILTEICQNAIKSISEDYSTEHWVPTLNKWWIAHKPKTEREKKLEKIKAVINKCGTYYIDDRCEEILKALEE